jgi:hypothetical protein
MYYFANDCIIGGMQPLFMYILMLDFPTPYYLKDILISTW